jgi:hypothetical protein
MAAKKNLRKWRRGKWRKEKWRRENFGQFPKTGAEFFFLQIF